MSTNYRQLYQWRRLVCVSDYVCVVDIGMFELSLRTSDGRDVVSYIVKRHVSLALENEVLGRKSMFSMIKDRALFCFWL